MNWQQLADQMAQNVAAKNQHMARQPPQQQQPPVDIQQLLQLLLQAQMSGNQHFATGPGWGNQPVQPQPMQGGDPKQIGWGKTMEMLNKK